MPNSTKNIDVNQGLRTKSVPKHQDFSGVTNDQFLNAVFGETFATTRPSVCEKLGDPAQGVVIAMSAISLSAQQAELKKTWGLIAVGESSLLELRPLWPKGIPDYKKAPSVHFSVKDFESIAACKVAFEAKALELNQQGFNVYTVMNPIQPDFNGPGAAKDVDIRHRDLLLIDIDRVDDTSRPANQAELDAAKELALEIRDYLADRDWPKPIVLMSANGYHLYYILEGIPNDLESASLVRRFLKNLSNRFDNAVVGVDTKVYNASRITKVPGTIARKGIETHDRPYRMAEVCDEI